MKNLVIGITGGIGSGKSTVSDYYLSLNHHVLKADDIAKKVMVDNENVKNKIISQFSDECYNGNILNTKVLAQKVFNNPENIKKLNSIVHPPTINYLKEEIEKSKTLYSLVFVEAALIFEAKMEDLFDYILLITAEENTRIRRVLERDTETVSEIRSRMLHQFPEEQKKGKSDFILENNSTIDDLQNRALFFLNLFKSMI
jgi:dephospho-CoA kinase